MKEYDTNLSSRSYHQDGIAIHEVVHLLAQTQGMNRYGIGVKQGCRIPSDLRGAILNGSNGICNAVPGCSET